MAAAATVIKGDQVSALPGCMFTERNVVVNVENMENRDWIGGDKHFVLRVDPDGEFVAVSTGEMVAFEKEMLYDRATHHARAHRFALCPNGPETLHLIAYQIIPRAKTAENYVVNERATALLRLIDGHNKQADLHGVVYLLAETNDECVALGPSDIHDLVTSLHFNMDIIPCCLPFHVRLCKWSEGYEYEDDLKSSEPQPQKQKL